MIVAAGALLSHAPAQADNSFRVETKEGPVKGYLKTGGVAVFLGIPYAEPPVGDLRWRPPKKHAAWTDVLDAKNFGPTCAQITTLGLFAGPANNNEDCLYLNVFSPNVDPASRTKLPVIFWIHGGGNVDGESNDYDAGKLAAEGDVVVVTINYRLNLMGFLAHPALDAEGHLFGNYGILDQQLALNWVRRNISAFGGDKNNVTVGGQSAGASNTAAQMISPLAAGLFHRAILQSGVSYFSGLAPLAVAEAKGVAFAAAAGCGSGADSATAQCLRNLPAEKVEALSGTQTGNGPYITYLVEDGQILPRSFTSSFQSGQFNQVPVMNGTVQDEANFTLGITEYFKKPRTPFTEDDFKNLVTSTYSGNAGPGGSPPAYPAGTVNKVLARYPLNAYASPQLAMDAVTTDVSACRSFYASELLASQTPVYGYEFQERTAPFYFPKMPGFLPLAYHTADIQFLFPLFHGGPDGIAHDLNKKQQVLADQMTGAWTNFAWTGNPNGQGNNPWPQYKGKPGSYYLAQNIPVQTTFTGKEFAAAHKCDFWQKILIYN
ncbi:carboxylesterase/lipase family protein [Methylocella silvestris]|uniref:carboxylesterase/lipase family protein n=1 Tax=Methylocella silvestris TaxID=199596 RepID=UPI0002D54BDF|nr:carboxylesterase family protein [Methylocella silvestris]